MLRVGLLMPRSTLYPALGIDWLNGIKAALQHLQLRDEVKLFIDNIGFGIEEPEIYSKAEKMLLQEDADLVVVFADTRIIDLLGPLFHASNKILLAVNFGANLPDNWQPNPTTLVHSFNFCLHTRLCGRLAAMEGNGQLANVISYFDGGYGQTFCMLNGSQQAGATPRFNHVTHFKMDAFTLEPLAAFLEENEDVRSLLCLFSGDTATRFYQDILPLQQKFNLALYVSPMMLEESLRAEMPADFPLKTVKGYTPWISDLPHEENQLFKSAFAALTGKEANLFGLLGWETAFLIQEIKKKMDDGERQAIHILDSLNNLELATPRGGLYLDPVTHYTYGPAWLVEAEGRLAFRVSGHNSPEADWSALVSDALPLGEVSSWRNTYLCI